MDELRVPGQRRPALAAPAVPGIAALVREAGPLFVAVGVFDGLHRGHLYLLRQLRRAARRHGARPAVVTFDAHPREIISGDAPPLLLDPEERLVRLAAAGVEVTVVQHFDEALRRTSYEDFVARIRERVELRGFLMTPDAAFGYQRHGTPETLGALGRRQGFDVAVVPPLLLDGRQVRSSEIRRAVEAGELAAARRQLGRAYSLVGERAADDPAGRTARLTFRVPVALPPRGRYRAAVGPAWEPGSVGSGSAVAGTAIVRAGGGLEVAANGALAETARLRVVFQGRRA